MMLLRLQLCTCTVLANEAKRVGDNQVAVWSIAGTQSLISLRRLYSADQQVYGRHFDGAKGRAASLQRGQAWSPLSAEGLFKLSVICRFLLQESKLNNNNK